MRRRSLWISYLDGASIRRFLVSFLVGYLSILRWFRRRSDSASKSRTNPVDWRNYLETTGFQKMRIYWLFQCCNSYGLAILADPVRHGAPSTLYIPHEKDHSELTTILYAFRTGVNTSAATKSAGEELRGARPRWRARRRITSDSLSLTRGSLFDCVDWNGQSRSL
jgi:hypothetical protein